MEFRIETTYNQKAVSEMAKVLRRTVRKKKSKRSHIWGIIVVVLGLLLTFLPGEEGFQVTFRTVLTWIVLLVILAVLIWEDKINGYIARKRMLAGTEKTVTFFHEEGYSSESDIGTSQWKYDKFDVLAETDEYFVFVFSQSHAQMHAKSGIIGGTVDEFREFIAEKTGKEIRRV